MGKLFTSLIFICFISEPCWAGAKVVLDPGHGGTNTGAYSPTMHTYEKKLTLSLAHALKNYLVQWSPGIEVIMTRSKDEYMTLKERSLLANRVGADLFMSIHFNASESHGQQGFETFILSRDAWDKETARLVSVENQEPAANSSSVNAKDKHQTAIKTILADLRYTAAYAESLNFAHAVQRSLARKRNKHLDRGVRQAPFDVLMGLSIPAVLIEVGFIDHPIEGKELSNPATQELIAIALAEAVLEFFDRQEKPTKHKK